MIADVRQLNSPGGSRARITTWVKVGRFILLLVVCASLAKASGQDMGDKKTRASMGAPIAAEQQQRAQTAELSPQTTHVSSRRHSKNKKALAKYDVTRIGERGIGNGVNLYSLERERALGRELADQVDIQIKLINDPEFNEFVNRVAQNLVRNSDAKVPFVIKVIDADEVNAFSLPGGYLYVNSGLVLAAETEAALAGVMAHEIAHVAARHATRNQTKAQLFSIASVPLVAFGGPAGLAVRQVAGLAVPLSLLKFGRNAEREADLLAIEYMYAAGYDPAEFVHFFERVRITDGETKSDKTSFLANIFSTHPMTKDRLDRAQNEIATMLPPKEAYIVTTSEFDEAVRRLATTLRQRHPDSAATPVLRRRVPQDGSQSGDTDTDPDRPTLRKRPPQQQ